MKTIPEFDKINREMLERNKHKESIANCNFPPVSSHEEILREKELEVSSLLNRIKQLEKNLTIQTRIFEQMTIILSQHTTILEQHSDDLKIRY